mmetsp:Transcript_139699/g.197840  ORF Transcript_139699/g.197840 Transcript_139699/m.197840 type:complete len:142 (-) Transcript_139699:412-837(-)
MSTYFSIPNATIASQDDNQTFSQINTIPSLHLDLAVTNTKTAAPAACNDNDGGFSINLPTLDLDKEAIYEYDDEEDLEDEDDATKYPLLNSEGIFEKFLDGSLDPATQQELKDQMSDALAIKPSKAAATKKKHAAPKFFTL